MQRLQTILLQGTQRAAGVKTRWVTAATAAATALPRRTPCAPTLNVSGSRTAMPFLSQPRAALYSSRSPHGLTRLTLSTPVHALRTYATAAATSTISGRGVSSGFLRSATATSALRSTPLFTALRAMSVRGKGGSDRAEADAEQQQRQEEGEKETKAEAEEKDAGEEGKASGGKGAKTKKGPSQQKKNSFADHIRGLKDDYAKFPDIYNSANMINCLIFTVFCLCSTGSNTEEKWWLDQWGVDNTFRPWNWVLHSFLTNNFLSMAYAMMLLHTLCHSMIPTIGSQGLLLYVVATAAISGAVMWAGNRLYYGSGNAPEKQFGPWDVVHALFVMYYLHFAITPAAVLSSFNSWMKYAVWVGEVCILYFDWQPTFVGTLVGLALCKGVPRFRVKSAA